MGGWVGERASEGQRAQGRVAKGRGGVRGRARQMSRGIIKDQRRAGDQRIYRPPTRQIRRFVFRITIFGSERGRERFEESSHRPQLTAGSAASGPTGVR